MILDTAFVIDVLDGDEGAVAALEEMEGERTQQKVSARTVFELYHGVVRAGKPEAEREVVLGKLRSKPVIAADERIMAKAGRLHGNLQREARPIGESDCIVAATAIVEEEPVVSRNVDHFDRIDDVAVRPY